MAKVMQEAIQQAVDEFIGSEGGIITGFVCLVTYFDKDGRRMWVYAEAKDQPVHTSLGISELIKLHVNGAASDMIAPRRKP
jgi:hypothetical protein